MGSSNNLHKIATIITEPCGRILGSKNVFPNTFNFKIENGISIDDIFPFLFGLFPMTQKEIILEDLSFGEFKGSIILHNNLKEVSISFYKHPKEAQLWEQTIQKHNQKKLINQLVMKTNNSTLSSSVFDTLGFMYFEKTDKGFVLTGNIPPWFQIIFPHYNYSSSIFDLEDLFPFLEVFIPETEHLFESETDGKLLSGMWSLYNEDNTEEFILQATAIRTDDSNFIFIENISERFPDKQKNVQTAREMYLKHQELIKTEKSLRKLFKHREQFISIFSHDIKGPLGGAYSLMNYLKKKEEFMNNFKPDQAEIFNMMYKGLGDLNDYVNRLYDWSNVHFGNIELDVSEVSLFDMCSNLKSLFHEKLEHKNLDIILNFPESAVIKVDQAFFKNALHNVINNSIKFSNSGQSITIQTVTTPTHITIQIMDKGVGITKKIQNTIFDYSKKQSRKGTDGEKGTGIGLTVVKRIIDMHHATITIDSIIRKGTTVSITLPR
jgi:signal transduction histidine kinase